MLALLVLAACAAREPVREAAEAELEYDRRAEALDEWTAWGLTGRLSIDDGADGGSGRLDWTVRESTSQLHFRGALGQGAWQLELDDAGATLRKADGTVVEEPSVRELVMRETGWQVPVEALQWWIRGLAQPGSEAILEYDPRGAGRLLALEQRGWRIEYGAYGEYAPHWLPTRLEATRDEHRVKLAISRWWFRSGVGGG